MLLHLAGRPGAVGVAFLAGRLYAPRAVLSATGLAVRHFLAAGRNFDAGFALAWRGHV